MFFKGAVRGSFYHTPCTSTRFEGLFLYRIGGSGEQKPLFCFICLWLEIGIWRAAGNVFLELCALLKGRDFIFQCEVGVWGWVNLRSAETICSGREVPEPETDKCNQQNGWDPEEAIIVECQGVKLTCIFNKSVITYCTIDHMVYSLSVDSNTEVLQCHLVFSVHMHTPSPQRKQRGGILSSKTSPEGVKTWMTVEVRNFICGWRKLRWHLFVLP